MKVHLIPFSDACAVQGFNVISMQVHHSMSQLVLLRLACICEIDIWNVDLVSQH